MITQAEYEAMKDADWFDPVIWGKVTDDRLHL